RGPRDGVIGGGVENAGRDSGRVSTIAANPSVNPALLTGTAPARRALSMSKKAPWQTVSHTPAHVGRADTEPPVVRSTADDLVAVIQRLFAARDVSAMMKVVRTAARELTSADGATFVLREGEWCHSVDEDAI